MCSLKSEEKITDLNPKDQYTEKELAMAEK